MPIRDLLKGMGGLEEDILPEVGAHQLHADWQTAAVEAYGESQPRHSGQVGRQGEHILQIHG